MWRVVAIDDEPPALLALEHALRDIEDFSLVGTTIDPRQASALIDELKPDVVFLDIHMPGLTGFDVVRELGERMPPVVFLTAYDQHAIGAFESHAIDYLLKPLDRNRLGQTLRLLRQRLTERRAARLTTAISAQMRDLLATMGVTPGGAAAQPVESRVGVPHRISLRSKGRTVLLDPQTIERVEVFDNDLRIVVGRETLVVRDTLTSLQHQLPTSQFVRVHRSMLVNIQRVRSVEPSGQSEYLLHMIDGARVRTGRTYRDQVRAALGLGSGQKE